MGWRIALAALALVPITLGCLVLTADPTDTATWQVDLFLAAPLLLLGGALLSVAWRAGRTHRP